MTTVSFFRLHLLHRTHDEHGWLSLRYGAVPLRGVVPLPGWPTRSLHWHEHGATQHKGRLRQKQCHFGQTYVIGCTGSYQKRQLPTQLVTTVTSTWQFRFRVGSSFTYNVISNSPLHQDDVCALAGWRFNVALTLIVTSHVTSKVFNNSVPKYCAAPPSLGVKLILTRETNLDLIQYKDVEV